MSQVPDAGSKKTITFTVPRPTPFLIVGSLGTYAILNLLFGRLPEMVKTYPLEIAGWLMMIAFVILFLSVTNHLSKTQVSHSVTNDSNGLLQEQEVEEDPIYAQAEAKLLSWMAENPGRIPVLMTATQVAACTELRSVRNDPVAEESLKGKYPWENIPSAL